ncbi:MAG: dihydroorotate dehydrogenase [Deltaproteobacteria bacterium]|nr:dihydroorotate dehydrogenase [Deltaproteobacteria bacterium]
MDLRTTYMGLELKHPIVPSASPLSYSLDRLKRLEDAGAPAVVMFSLFEEQMQWESQLLAHTIEMGSDSVGEYDSFWPHVDFQMGPDAYLHLLENAKKSLDIPVIGSLNCVTPGGWTEYATWFEEAGADAIELNIYHIPTDVNTRGVSVEQQYIELVDGLRAHVKIPIAIKLHPFFSSIPHMAAQLSQHGAQALVLFNRFYQPDFDLEQLEVTPNLVLSDAHELRLPLRWTSILVDQIDADIAITSGVHSYQDVLKSMMAGAKVSMMASELLRNGLGRINEIVGEITQWMQEREYESIRQMQGSMSHKNVANPAAFERANYIGVLQSFSEDPTGRLL